MKNLLTAIIILFARSVIAAGEDYGCAVPCGKIF